MQGYMDNSLSLIEMAGVFIINIEVKIIAKEMGGVHYDYKKNFNNRVA
jgi:hypothetical protein